MRVATAIVMLGCVFPIQSCAECLPFSEAPKNIGASKCTTGKVLKVTCGVSGTYFLNFCPDYRGCPLSGRGVPCRLRHVGREHHDRSEEHTSELQSRENLVCRLL